MKRTNCEKKISLKNWSDLNLCLKSHAKGIKIEPKKKEAFYLYISVCFCSSFLMWTGWFSRKLGLKTLNNISCFQCGESRDCSKRKTSHSALLRFGGRFQEGKKCQIIFTSLLFKSNFVRVLWGLWLQIKCIWLVNAAFQDKFKLFSSNKSFKNMLGEKQIKKSDWGVVFSHNWT